MTIYIYTLTNPISNQVFYIGKTSDVVKRLSSHLSINNRETNNKAAIIRYLLLNGLKPSMDVIDEIQCEYREDEDYAGEIEMYWINQFRAWGFNLVNDEGIKSTPKKMRKYEHLLKQSTYEYLMDLIDKKVDQIKNIIDSAKNCDSLTDEEKELVRIKGKQTYLNWLKKLYLQVGFTEEELIDMPTV